MRTEKESNRRSLQANPTNIGNGVPTQRAYESEEEMGVPPNPWRAICSPSTSSGFQIRRKAIEKGNLCVDGSKFVSWRREKGMPGHDQWVTRQMAEWEA